LGNNKISAPIRKLMKIVAACCYLLFLVSSNGKACAFQTQISNAHANSKISNTKIKPISRSSTELDGMWSNNDIDGPDRIKSCIPYVLPLLDGDSFGKYIYERVPPLNTIDELFIAPLVSILESYPFLSLILFFIFTLGTRNVPGMSRAVRFNAQQAVLIDVALILPTLFSEGLADVEIPRVYAEVGSTFTYYVLMSCILYSVVSNLKGEKPDQLPFVSPAAEMMTGPF